MQVLSSNKMGFAANDSTPFMLVPCLAKSLSKSPPCVSFMSVNQPGFFARHQNYVLYLHSAATQSDVALFYKDASFMIIADKFVSGAVSFQSFNFPNFAIQFNQSTGEVTVDQGTTTFKIMNALSRSNFRFASENNDACQCGFSCVLCIFIERMTTAVDVY